MKKERITVLLSVLTAAVIMLSGCVSIPKTVKEDEALVIISAEYLASGYEYVNGKKINVELLFENSETNKTYTAYTDKNNFAILCVPGDAQYFLRRVKYRGSSGEALWVEINNQLPFYIDNGVINNLGYWIFNFNGKTNWVTWYRMDAKKTEKSFNNLGLESEWVNRPIEEK